MKVLSWIVPVKPENVEKVRRVTEAIEGARRSDYEKSEKRIGIEREVWFLVEKEDQAYCVIYMQGEDLEATIKAFGASTDEFDVWARDCLLQISDGWPDPIWSGFPAQNIMEVLSVYDAAHPGLDARGAHPALDARDAH